MSFFGNLQIFFAKKNINFIGIHKNKKIDTLFPEERKKIANVILTKQEEFASGRWCARKAMERSGVPGRAIFCGSKGEPVWPDDLCGSISHTKGAACAAAASLSNYRSLGLDIENAGRIIKDDTLKLIVNRDEFKWLLKTGNKRRIYEKLIFCVKESAYKLLYPFVKTYFSFSAVSVFFPQGIKNPGAIKKERSDNVVKGDFSFILNKKLSPGFPKGWKGQGWYFYNNKWVLTLSYIKRFTF